MEVDRVQHIASMSKVANQIPEEFIRSIDEQPGVTTFHGPEPEIPVIDLANTNHDQIIHEIVKASQQWGIFQVINHAIPPEVIRELQRVGKEFFEMPQEEKEKVAMVPGQLEGYGSKMTNKQQGTKNWVDFLFHNIWPQSQINHAFWPKNPPEYRFDLSLSLCLSLSVIFNYSLDVHEMKFMCLINQQNIDLKLIVCSGLVLICFLDAK
jgi:flavonol synthase